jgi:hypothetical protein
LAIFAALFSTAEAHRAARLADSMAPWQTGASMVHSLLLALLILLAAAGCGGPSYMTQAASPQPPAADPAMATVFFIRPSGYAGGREYVILDETGRFLGEVKGESYFVTKMPPGEHSFVAWSEGSPTLRATLEAGKIYYVEVGVVIGAWSPRARLFAIGPQRKPWPELAGWLAQSRLLVPTQGAEQRFAQDKGAEAREVVQKGLAEYAGYDAEAKSLRTLTPADGVPAPAGAAP